MKKIFLSVLAVIMLTLTTNAQSDMKVSIMGGLNSPTGDMGDLYKSTFGGYASFTFKLSESWDLGASVGYSKWSADNEYWSKIVSDTFGETIAVEADVPYTAIPVLLDLYYYFSRGNFQPYLTLSLGAHFTTTEANSIVVNEKVFDIGVTESNTVAGYKLGGGFLYSLSPRISLNVAATVDGNSLEFSQSSTTSGGGTTTTNSSTTTTSYFSIMAGISFAL